MRGAHAPFALNVGPRARLRLDEVKADGALADDRAALRIVNRLVEVELEDVRRKAHLGWAGVRRAASDGVRQQGRSFPFTESLFGVNLGRRRFLSVCGRLVVCVEQSALALMQTWPMTQPTLVSTGARDTSLCR